VEPAGSGVTDPNIGSSYPAVIAGIVTEDTISDGWLRDHIAVYTALRERDLAVVKGYDGRHIAWRRWKESPETLYGRDDTAELRAAAIQFNGRHYFLPTIKRIAVSEYAIYLAVLYVIGQLARYYPDYWVPMQRERTEEFFLIQEFLDTAEDKIPNLALNHLSKQTNVYRSA
jgi:hypothetical protein